MPGPIVDETVIDRRYWPLDADGFARTIGLEQRQRIGHELIGGERLLAHGDVDIARLVDPELDLARLDLAHGPPHVERHGAELRIGHEAARAQHLAELADLAHEVRGRDGRIELHPSALDSLDEVLGPDHVGARLSSLPLLLTLGEYRHPHRLADSVREHDGTPHHLIGVLRVDPEAQRHVDALVELRGGQLLDDLERLLDGVRLLLVEDRAGGLLALRHHRHALAP